MTLTPEEIQAIAAALWSYPVRSLTTQTAGSILPAPGEPLTIYRDTTVVLEFETAEILAGTNVWFTVKDDLDALDTTATLQVQSDVGLNFLDGYEKTGTDKLLASLVYSGTRTTVTVTPGASVYLPIYQAKPLSWDLKISKDGIVTILQSGKIYILPTATRAV